MPEIDLADPGVRGDGVHIVLDQDTALVKHGHDIGDHTDKLHVVLDPDQRRLFVYLANQFGRPGDLVLSHAGGRFIQQHEPGFGRHHHAKLDPLALAMRQATDQVGANVG